MKVVLAMIARSSGEPYLDRVLSVLRPLFDGVEILYDEGQPIVDFAAARNRLIRVAEAKGYDWIFMVDADECMFPGDVARVRCLMERGVDFIALPRVELVNDFNHWDPSMYPDYQARVFRLGRGYHYRNPVHEMLYARAARRCELEKRDFARSDSTPLYHYGKTKPAAVVVSKLMQYEAIKTASTALDTLDVRGAVLWPDSPRFEHPHPLDGTNSGGGDWAQYGMSFSTAKDEVSLLYEHLDLLQELDSHPGSLLGVGPAAALIGRYLASRGHDVVTVGGEAGEVADAAELNQGAASLHCQIADARGLSTDSTGGAFAATFSLNLLHRRADEEIRDLVVEQMRAAKRVVFDVPSDRSPRAPLEEGRYLSPEEWERILAPVGRVRARYSGASLLPLREALVAKARGNLRQDRVHVLGVVTEAPEARS